MSSPKLVAEFLNHDGFPPSKNVYNKGGDDRVLETNELTRKFELSSVEGKRDKARETWRKLIQRSTDLGGRTEHKIERSPFIGIDPKVIKALSSIRILNDDPNNQSWLRCNGGRLDSLPMDLLEAIERCAPKSFHARVADFNDNLFYNMQEQYGLNHMIHQHQSSTVQANPDKIVKDILKTNKYLGSFLATEKTMPQPPHVDFTWERLEEDGDNLRIGFFPLTEEGMFLQVWSRNDDLEQRNIQGEIICIPFGKMLTLPATTIHGGGFRTTALQDHGNLRFHLYVAYDEADLSKNQTTNKYTEPNDKRKELTDRYTNAPMMEELMELLFFQ